jgi:hypothetical protein
MASSSARLASATIGFRPECGRSWVRSARRSRTRSWRHTPFMVAAGRFLPPRVLPFPDLGHFRTVREGNVHTRIGAAAFSNAFVYRSTDRPEPTLHVTWNRPSGNLLELVASAVDGDFQCPVSLGSRAAVSVRVRSTRVSICRPVASRCGRRDLPPRRSSVRTSR